MCVCARARADARVCVGACVCNPTLGMSNAGLLTVYIFLLLGVMHDVNYSYIIPSDSKSDK